MESFEWKTNQTKSYPRGSIKYYASNFDKLLTFEKDSSVFKVPHLYTSFLPYSSTGPQYFVQIDSSLYHLNNRPFSQVSREWISSITVLKESAKGYYGYEGKDGMVIIRLHKTNEDDFLKGKIDSNPMKISNPTVIK